MVRYLTKRAVSSLVALALFVTFMFFATEIMIPHDYTAQFALTCDQECRQALQEELGIDLPLWQRYLNWAGRLLSGDLGTSFAGVSVTDNLVFVVPYTLLLYLVGTVISFQLGMWLGKVTGWRGPGFLSSSAVLTSITFYTMFPPWLAFLVR